VVHSNKDSIWHRFRVVTTYTVYVTGCDPVVFNWYCSMFEQGSKMLVASLLATIFLHCLIILSRRKVVPLEVAKLYSISNFHTIYIIHRWIWPRAWLTWTDGRRSGDRLGAGGGRGRTTCANRLRARRRQRGRHGAWLTAGGQATV